VGPYPAFQISLRRTKIMAINATDAFTNSSTAAPPPNPLKSGLFSIRDFVRKGQEKEYANTLIDLMTELSPKGVLEECYAAEIMKSTWRLRRCRNIEFDLAESTELDPMIDEKTSNHQKTVDRARTQSHFLLRHSLAQLSKLQTARTIRLQLEANQTNHPAPAAGPINMDALMALAEHQLAEKYRESGLASFCNPAVGQVPDLPSTEPAAPPTPTSFCKAAEPAPYTHNPGQAIGSKVPRNAPCPCGSTMKFKKCCGNPAAPEVKPVLDQAA
jgi:hypothetical protein